MQREGINQILIGGLPFGAIMRLLVAGAAGFIASRVCHALLDQGHEVVGFDELNDAYDPRLKAWRLQQLLDRERFAFAKGDIAELASFVRVASDGRYDAVLNLAARAGVRQSIEDPWVYLRTNATGTLNVLESCRRHDIPTMLLASTSSLYGATPERPFREETPTDRPLSPYAASKKAAEAMAASYTHLYGIHTPVPRFFTVYGPAGRPDMSVFRFIRWIAEGEPVVVYGDGSQERDFTFVEDIARGAIAALSVRGHEIVNLGSDSPHKLNDLIATIERHLGQRARIDRRPVHPADVRATWADISKARRLLDWAPKYTLDDGIRETVAWYRDNRAWVKDLELGQA